MRKLLWKGKEKRGKITKYILLLAVGFELTNLRLVNGSRPSGPMKDRGVTGGWAEWAIAHPVFGRIEGAAGQRRWRALLLLAHPVLGTHLRPCVRPNTKIENWS